jgi:hypothetical protein
MEPSLRLSSDALPPYVNALFEQEDEAGNEEEVGVGGVEERDTDRIAVVYQGSEDGERMTGGGMEVVVGVNAGGGMVL